MEKEIRNTPDVDKFLELFKKQQSSGEEITQEIIAKLWEQAGSKTVTA